MDLCEPVFVLNAHLPAFEQKSFSTAEICTAAEKVCGFNTIEGAQRIGGLWRVYPRQKEGRQKLLIHGLVLRGVTVNVCSKNPYLMHTSDTSNVGDKLAFQQATTRLVISNVPLSFSDSEILETVKQLGVNILSKLIAECDRDANGRLTHWKTGRRFVYIAVPAKPLPKSTRLGPFTAALYHKEQKTEERQQEAACRRCFEKGHKAAECLAPIKCRQCLQSGHKAGDPLCSFVNPSAADSEPSEPSVLETQTAQAAQEAQAEVVTEVEDAAMETEKKTNEKENSDTTKDKDNTQKHKAKENKKNQGDKTRGRSRQRQQLPHGQTTMEAFRRAASGSVKRKTSDETAAGQGKQRRLEGDDDDDNYRDDNREEENEVFSQALSGDK